MWEAALSAHLKNEDAVADIVGNRIYREYAPTNAVLPYIVIAGPIPDTRHTHQGGTNSVRQVAARIQAFSSDQQQLVSIGDALVSLLAQHRGALGVAGNTVETLGVFFDGESVNVLEPKQAGETFVFVRTQVYLVWYKES